MADKINDIDRNSMFERGKITLNGYTFTVKPILLGEEDDYREDVKYNLYPRNPDGTKKTDCTELELKQYIRYLFKKDDMTTFTNGQAGLLKKIKLWLVKTFRRDYMYYSDNLAVLGLVKWIEKKVYYKGRHIRFYDLERKYKLTKIEILKLFEYFEELSDFL